LKQNFHLKFPHASFCHLHQPNNQNDPLHKNPRPSSPVPNQKPWSIQSGDRKKRENERVSVRELYVAAAGPKAEATSPMRAGGMAIDGVASCYMTHSPARKKASHSPSNETIPSAQDKHKMGRGINNVILIMQITLK
jgi:hypothetical protein